MGNHRKGDTGMGKEPIISLKDIAVSFDGEAILKLLNLTIQDGEFVTLLGPSGVTNIIYDWLHQCNSYTSFLGCPYKKFLFIPAKNTLIFPCCQKRPRRVVRPDHSRNPRSPQA